MNQLQMMPCVVCQADTDGRYTDHAVCFECYESGRLLGWLATHGSEKEPIMKQIQIFTDGACLGNPGPGGWAALLRCGDRERLLRDAEPHTTNNRMELKALLEGLRALTTPCQVTVTTDSQYVRGVLALGWKRKTNLDLLTGVDDLLKIHTVSFVWTAGHAGHPENERVDTAARAEAERAKAQLQDPAYLAIDTLPQRTECYTRQLHELVADLGCGNIYVEDFDPDLIARLSALLYPVPTEPTTVPTHTGTAR